MGLREEDHRGKVPSSSRRIRVHTNSTAYGCGSCFFSFGWDNVWQVSPVKLLFPPFPFCSPHLEVMMYNPHLRSKEVCSSTSLRAEWLYKLFEILLHGRFESHLAHLFISVWTHGYLLYALNYNPKLFYLFILFLKLRILSVNFCVPLTYPHHCGL